MKSNVLEEAENPFTIFATVEAEAGAVLSNTSAGAEEGFQQESSIIDRDDTGLYDSPYEGLTDQNDLNIDNFNDFELDLSEVDGPESESWNIGATLAEDLSETTSVAPEDLLKDSELETGEFEVQGLGFDFNADLDQTDTDDSHDVEGDKETPPAQDDFFLPDTETDPEQDSTDDLDEISLETELETDDLEPEAEQTSEAPLDLNDPEIEMSPTLELEELQLDLETDSPEIEPIQNEEIEPIPTDLSADPETPLEDLDLKMDSDEEPTPDR